MSVVVNTRSYDKGWISSANLGYAGWMAKKTQSLEQILVAALSRTGLGLTEFCDTHGINPRTIYRWRQGDFAAPRMTLVIRSAQALGVSYEVLTAALDDLKSG